MGRSWPHLGVNFGNFLLDIVMFRKNHFFEDKTVRRRFRDQLRPKKAPKGPKMTPKRDPRSTPKRPKIDIKIDINFDANSKGRQLEVGYCSLGLGPPREPLGGATGTPRSRQSTPPGTHARVLNKKIIIELKLCGYRTIGWVDGMMS